MPPFTPPSFLGWLACGSVDGPSADLRMRFHGLFLGLLLVVNLCLATWLEPWFQNWSGSRTQSDNLLQVVLGDGRRLFAAHFFAKADAYYHNGFYPTIYDLKEGFDKNHIAGAQSEHAEEEANFLGEPLDWLDRF